ncbi:ABC transporter ATP-binding protein [Ideonella livida]|uniref:ATP-binding cassette domain-containing protein n=1 Tax=Ideonella livida TaxID=2707176 RepID=A0A7C9PI33_9BURK|nr:ATP-binding cassette domain-containing protein [Ideonella livida]NDY91752.1 ATP-binding cassette domain-containing protein [Ideonella livida]
MAAPVLCWSALRQAWPGQPLLLDLPPGQVAVGERLFLHGPSGCGKSTLLALFCGMLTAQSGQVSLQGQDWAALPAGRRDAWRATHLGFVGQQFNLLPWWPALDNVLLPARFSPARARAAAAAAGGLEAAALDLLERMGLSPALARQPAGQLSVGQQQRVAAARALLGGPALLVADEPTSALDEDSRAAFLQTWQQACAQAGSALVLVSHDRRLAEGFDRVLHLPSLNRAGPPAGTRKGLS